MMHGTQRVWAFNTLIPNPSDDQSRLMLHIAGAQTSSIGRGFHHSCPTVGCYVLASTLPCS
jgi:hypothetical protein